MKVELCVVVVETPVVQVIELVVKDRGSYAGIVVAMLVAMEQKMMA